MATTPKTIEAVRKTLRGLGEDVRVSLQLYLYDHAEPGALYTREDWHASVSIKNEGIEVNTNAHDGATIVKQIKELIAKERQSIKMRRRITHNPKLIEFKELA